MIFEKTNANISKPIVVNWPPCSNCDNKGNAYAGYHGRSSSTASELNAKNNGKGCVS